MPHRHDDHDTRKNAVRELIEILTPEPVEEWVFVGQSPSGIPGSVFGGQLVAQALAAAAGTVDRARAPHSLHCNFVRACDPAAQLTYLVEPGRDGRSFSLRTVTAVQSGTTVCSLSVSFHVRKAEITHQQAMPDVPRPETLPTLEDWLATHRPQLPPWWARPQPIELRYVGEPPHLRIDPSHAEPRELVWLRCAEPLPADPILHACVLAYASDLTLLDPILRAHGEPWLAGRLDVTSLDHAIWLHRPVRADEWLLYSQESPSAHGGRAFCRGQIHSADGQLIASVAQEGAIRRPRQPS